MGNYTTFVDFCHDVLTTVTAVGVIHKRAIDLRDLDEVEQAITDGIGDARKINAWFITREGAEDVRDGAPSGQGFRYHRFLISGYYQLVEADSTETTFQNIIDSVMDAFETRLTKVTGGSPQIVEYTQPLRIRRIGHTRFAKYLVHFCEIEVVYRERRTINTRI